MNFPTLTGDLAGVNELETTRTKFSSMSTFTSCHIQKIFDFLSLKFPRKLGGNSRWAN